MCHRGARSLPENRRREEQPQEPWVCRRLSGGHKTPRPWWWRVYKLPFYQSRRSRLAQGSSGETRRRGVNGDRGRDDSKSAAIAREVDHACSGAVVEFHCSRSHFRLDNAGSRAPEPPGEVPLDFVGDSPNHSNGGLPRWEVDRRGRVAVDFQGDTEVDLCFMYVTESPSVSME